MMLPIVMDFNKECTGEKYKAIAEAFGVDTTGMTVAEGAKEFLEAHRVMPYRAQTVMYKLLRYYMEYCQGLAKCLIPKCYGAGKEAAEMWEKFVADFGRHECEIETCYDQWMMYYAFEHKVFASQEMTVPTVEN